MEKPIQSSQVPPTLTFFKGGLNLGIFYPGPPVSTIGSDVLGNENTGKAMTYRVSASGNGMKDSAWVLILAPDDIKNVILREEDETSASVSVSSYDGAFNKIQLSGMKKIHDYKKGGYLDWYIPSRDELAFIANNLPKNFNLLQRFIAMSDSSYMTSTYNVQNYSAKTDGKKVSLLYSQSFNEYTYGDTSLVSDGKSITVRMVRKVPVYIN